MDRPQNIQRWRQPLAIGLVGCAALAFGSAAALLRWSAWWPHRDMRQIWANNLTAFGLIVGLLSLLKGMRFLTPRHRFAGLTLGLVTGTVVAFLGYEALIDFTIVQR